MACLLLVACATPAPPQPIYISAPPAPPVKYIVKQPCVDKDKLKPIPPSTSFDPADPVSRTNSLAADAINLRVLAQDQYELLKSCTTVKEEKVE